jgi:uncharacterized membrane protein YeaQ/YmgE (transglycosylase-associated protein family)
LLVTSLQIQGLVMGIMVWIVPGLLSGMIAKRPAGWRRGPPGLIIGVTGAAGAVLGGWRANGLAPRLSGSGTAHFAAAWVGPTELGPLA